MKKWIIIFLPVFLGLGVALAWWGPFQGSTPAGGQSVVVVYKSPTCGCCGKWEEHLKAAGFQIESRPTEAMNPIKAEHGVPIDLQSCHTAIVEGYVVEGHVPAASIKKLLAEKPVGVKGISVPGMPIGSPGMEGPNPEKYDVVTINDAGKSEVFESY